MKSKRAKSIACRLLPTACRALGLAICERRFAILAGCLLALAAGCQNARSRRASLAGQVEKLSQENTQLKNQIEQAETENEQLKKQMEVLSSLPEGERENLYELERIRIGRYTGFYDKDKDGKTEKLIVYIQPLDKEGDMVKAAGAVDVQLWNLNNKAGEALLGEWHVGPNELKRLWFATLMSYYRLIFDVADKIDRVEEPLTVRVSFTNYLTGKVFKEQKVIKPH